MGLQIRLCSDHHGCVNLLGDTNNGLATICPDYNEAVCPGLMVVSCCRVHPLHGCRPGWLQHTEWVRSVLQLGLLTAGGSGSRIAMKESSGLEPTINLPEFHLSEYNHFGCMTQQIILSLSRRSVSTDPQ